MSGVSFAPPYTPAAHALAALRQNGFALLDPQGVQSLLDVQGPALQGLNDSWNRLCPDVYLKDQGKYRHRRHASYQLDTQGQLTATAHRAHWQPLSYNALHGGIERWFEPVEPAIANHPTWRQLLQGLGRLAQAHFTSTAPSPMPKHSDWFIEAHQFRIDTANGIGRPTPEGAHRDGVDLVAVFVLSRHLIKGGESRVFAIDNPSGQRFTLDQPWSLLLMDDARVIHETTPIQPADPPQTGWRDTLVVTLRRHGFLDQATYQAHYHANLSAR